MRLSESLKWIFALLFLSCGLPLLWLDTGGTQGSAASLLAGIACLSLGGFCFALAWEAWRRGAINLQNFRYTRAAQPGRFLTMVLLVLIAGCGTVAAAVWLLLFKHS
ncbi:MAG TPA: hypothetical protein VK973_16500 [Arenicellales bacterium]|nr:hypothetical protein [Arenicellales bacterium]